MEKVAEDIVAHFMGRKQSDSGSAGKGMVICIDKLTAVRVYDKVQKYWKAYLGGLKAQLAQSKGRSGLLWWLISLFLGPIATFLIVILPKESQTP